eukprot:29767_1
MYHQLLLLSNSNNRKYFHLIQRHIQTLGGDKDEVKSEDKITRRMFNSLHSYLCHADTELFRTKNKLIDSKMRFATEVHQQNTTHNKTKVYEIDFGENILKWLKYKEKPTFD